eukprot:TRINITY_DN17663_c0_g1_i1.p1 TRINITY_DN17663_c0_g1~~TRINITY_DN17663_c0_g1_i1.p1  ORF type:complete len:121 (+),score=39.91 TRINITY_DN17663_c0_g1_i1:2-364(+)
MAVESQPSIDHPPSQPAPSHAGPSSSRFACLKSAVPVELLQQCFERIVETFTPHMVKYSNTNPLIPEGDGEHGSDVQWKVSSYMDLDRSNEGAMQREVAVNLELREALSLIHISEPTRPY